MIHKTCTVLQTQNWGSLIPLITNILANAAIRVILTNKTILRDISSVHLTQTKGAVFIAYRNNLVQEIIGIVRSISNKNYDEIGLNANRSAAIRMRKAAGLTNPILTSMPLGSRMTSLAISQVNATRPLIKDAVKLVFGSNHIE